MRRTASGQPVSPVGQGTEPATVASQAAVGIVSGGIVVGHDGRTLALVQESAGVSVTGRKQVLFKEETRKKKKKSKRLVRSELSVLHYPELPYLFSGSGSTWAVVRERRADVDEDDPYLGLSSRS